jgi:serine/threonine protein kinase
VARSRFLGGSPGAGLISLGVPVVEAIHLSDLRERLQAALCDTYRLERELGGGGMSRVFVAEERELRRRVLIKVLPPDLAAGINTDRFRREVQLAASLQYAGDLMMISAAPSSDLPMPGSVAGARRYAKAAARSSCFRCRETRSREPTEC